MGLVVFRLQHAWQDHPAIVLVYMSRFYKVAKSGKCGFRYKGEGDYRTRSRN